MVDVLGQANGVEPAVNSRGLCFYSNALFNTKVVSGKRTYKRKFLWKETGCWPQLNSCVLHSIQIKTICPIVFNGLYQPEALLFIKPIRNLGSPDGNRLYVPQGF